MDAIDVELDHVFSTRIHLRISISVLGIDDAEMKGKYNIIFSQF